jgi:hypothetical protein
MKLCVDLVVTVLSLLVMSWLIRCKLGSPLLFRQVGLGSRG